MNDYQASFDSIWLKYGYMTPRDVRHPGPITCEPRRDCMFFAKEPDPGYCDILHRTYCKHGSGECHFYKREETD